jgi:hypothetical protein
MSQYSGHTPTGVGPTGHATSATLVHHDPKDRVRWGPILAGLFVALSTLAVLTVLGVAIGLTAWDPGERAEGYGWGAAIWSGLSALVAFFVGGMIASKSAAVAGERNGLLNGVMVWAVAIPLMLYLIGGGIGSMVTTTARTAGDVATAGAQVATNNQNTTDVTDRARTAAEQVGGQLQASMPNAETVDEHATTAAWSTLIALLLGLAAAAAGGYMGARETYHDHGSRHTVTT